MASDSLWVVFTLRGAKRPLTHFKGKPFRISIDFIEVAKKRVCMDVPYVLR